MKFQALLGAAIAATAVFVSMQGCTASTAASPTIKCTPGAYTLCMCADQSKGTKLCKPDGASFEACTTSGTGGECVGGEDLTATEGNGTEIDPPIKEPAQEAGPPGSAVDSCPGKATAIGNEEVVIVGDTTGAAGDFKGRQGACSAGDGGPDHVYHIQPSGTGALSVKVKGEGALNPLIYLRSTCSDEESQTSCAPPLGAGSLVQFSANVVTGRDYYLVVDGASGSAGKYQLTLKLTTGGFCGDGKVDTGEACDDSNHTEGDGCSASCRGVSGDPASADCSKPHVVHMWKGATVSGTGSTTNYGDTFTTPGTSCTAGVGTNPSPDHVYEVTAHAAGNLKVTITPDGSFNPQLIARRTCTDATTSGAGMCAYNTGSGPGPEVMTFAVQNTQKVYVAATGALTSKGSYTIKFELP
jgi:cysteine-rich repeat protein